MFLHLGRAMAASASRSQASHLRCRPITQLRVTDNQFVHKGDILYQIEPFDFDVTLRTSKALLEQREADLHVKQLQFERRQRLSDLATTPEEQQVFQGKAIQATAAVDAARQQVAQADINLKRTEVRSPVNGYVTNLLLRVGDYAHVGVSNISIIDTDSFWVDGYFEETKLARVCVGDRAEAQLIGYSMPITGHVTTITEALACPMRRPALRVFPVLTRSTRGYAWRNASPVRIAIDKVPPGLPLVSGATATVTIRDDSRVEKAIGLDRAKAVLTTSLYDMINGVSPQPGCIPLS